MKDNIYNLKSGERIHCSINTISEVYYVLCRIRGKEFASEKLDELFASRLVSFDASIELAVRTGQLKCKRSISLADCSVLAVAELAKCPAVFLKETELEKEMAKEVFECKIILL